MMRRRPIARAAVRTTAVVGTAAVVGGHMANKQAAQAQRAAAEAPPAAAAPEPAAAAPDPIEQLTQLAALKDSGLTEAEFEAQKPSSWVRRAVFETATATRVMGRVVSAVAILRVGCGSEKLYGNADSLVSESVTNSKSHVAQTQWRWAWPEAPSGQP